MDVDIPDPSPDSGVLTKKLRELDDIDPRDLKDVRHLDKNYITYDANDGFYCLNGRRIGCFHDPDLPYGTDAVTLNAAFEIELLPVDNPGEPISCENDVMVWICANAARGGRPLCTHVNMVKKYEGPIYEIVYVCGGKFDDDTRRLHTFAAVLDAFIWHFHKQTDIFDLPKPFITIMSEGSVVLRGSPTDNTLGRIQTIVLPEQTRDRQNLEANLIKFKMLHEYRTKTARKQPDSACIEDATKKRSHSQCMADAKAALNSL